MKKIILILTISVSITACKKSYQCVCEIKDVSGLGIPDKKTEYSILSKNKSSASNECKGADYSNAVTQTKCDLK